MALSAPINATRIAVKKEMSSARAAWSISQTTTSANGGHLTMVVVTYGFAPRLSCWATVSQLSRSSECADRGHVAMTAARTSQEQPSTTSRSRAAGGSDRVRHQPTLGRIGLAQILVRLHVEPHREQRELRPGDEQQRDENDGADADGIACDPVGDLDDAEDEP